MTLGYFCAFVSRRQIAEDAQSKMEERVAIHVVHVLGLQASFAHELGVPGNHSFLALLELRLACVPIVVEYLFLVNFAHDQSLIRYIASFPGSLWPDLSRIPATTLYILWSPLHDKVYAGRTINFVRRHLDHTHRIHCQTCTGSNPSLLCFQVTRFP